MNGAAEEKSPGTITSGRRSAPAGSTETEPGLAADLRPGRLEHELGVVARRRRFDDRRLALRVQSCQEDGRLHLGARDGQRVFDPLQLCTAVDDDRRQSVGRLDLRAHPLERLGDAVHGPRSQRLVTGQLEATLLAGEDPGQESHQRAGVPGVDRLVGSPKAAHPHAVDDELVVGDVVDLNPERPHGVDSRQSVGRPSEAANVRLALGECADEHRAV